MAVKNPVDNHWMHNIAKNYSNNKKNTHILHCTFCTLFRPYSHLFSKNKAKMAKIYGGGTQKGIICAIVDKIFAH